MTTVISSSSAIEPRVTGSHQPCGHARSAADQPRQRERREHGADRERLGLIGEPARQALAREPGAARGAPPESANGRPASHERGERRPGVHGGVEHERARRVERVRDARAGERAASSEHRHDRQAQAAAAACRARR